MTFLKRKPWKLVTITSTIIAIVIFFLVLISGIIQVSSYKLDMSLYERNEYIISNSLINSDLYFEVATGNLEGIKKIVSTYLAYDEIYSIEVQNHSGEILYRKQKKLSKSLEIKPKEYNLLSQHSKVAINSLDVKEEDNVKIIGKVIITFSSEYIKNKIINQTILTGSLLLFITIIIGIFLYIFNRFVSNNLSNIINKMHLVAQGNRIDVKRDGLHSIEEVNTINTSLKVLSDEIYERDSQLSDSLNRALEAKISAQEADQFKDDFIRAISHDIKTPIGVIINLIKIISDEYESIKDNPSLTEKINACYQSSLALKDIIEELFNFEEFDQKKLIENPVKTNPNELFLQIESLYSAKFFDKGLGFTIHKDQNSHITNVITVDRGKIILVLDNLIENALKFTCSGAVTITWSITSEHLLIEIKDSGIGIPEDKYQVIFNKHTQLSNISTSKHTGRGLGLFYVKRILDLLKANISISSKVDIGSIFKISIPIVIDEVIPVENTLLLQESINTEHFKALIIDDDERTCFTLTQMLGKYDIESSYECIPEIGLSRIVKESFDIVFIDFHMPSLSGDQIVKKVASVIPKNTTFYVCITAETNNKYLEELAAIFHEILKKPFDLPALESVLTKALTSKKITNNLIEKINSKN